MSRGLKMFLRKREKSQSNHNGKVLEKLGQKLLSTGNLYFYKKRIQELLCLYFKELNVDRNSSEKFQCTLL